MVNIRKIEVSDVERVTEIARRVFPIPRSEAYFQRLFRKYPKDFYVAESNNEVVGFILARVKEKELGWVERIAVQPQNQNQGIGTAMMSFIFDQLKATGAGTIGLYARTSNQRGVSFYQKLGFQVVHRIPGHYKNGDDAYQMDKQLQ